MWNPEKYDEKAREVMQASSSLAKNEKVMWRVHHVAVALLEHSAGCVTNTLQSIVDSHQITRCALQIREQARNIPNDEEREESMHFELFKFKSKVEADASSMNSAVSNEDLLLMLTDPHQYAPTEIVHAPIDIASILANFGITKEAVEKALADIPKP